MSMFVFKFSVVVRLASDASLVLWIACHIVLQCFTVCSISACHGAEGSVILFLTITDDQQVNGTTIDSDILHFFKVKDSCTRLYYI